jgi:hypothetical protein
MVSVILFGLVYTFLSLVSAGTVSLKHENHVALERIDCICTVPLCANATCSMIRKEVFKYDISVKAVITKAQPKVIVNSLKISSQLATHHNNPFRCV